MPQDIRKYFCSPKASSQKKPEAEEKSRKKSKRLIDSDEESKDTSSSTSKNIKAVNHKKSKDNRKKRTISSDEDEIEWVHINNKKVKTMDNGNNIEKLEEVEDPAKMLNSKPSKRINAPEIPKKVKEETVKKPTKNESVDFIDEDDLDPTLNQLDAQIEDEYLAKAKNGTDSKFFKAEKKEKSETHNEKEGSVKEKKTTPDSKSKDKEHSHKKHEEKKKKNSHHPKLEIEKETKSQKSHAVKKELDSNEIIEEKVEKKKQHAILYQNYLNRGGARNPGSKDVPKGAENCLANLTFLLTGIYESLEREELDGIIKQYGGKTVHSVSKKLSYMIVGSEPGPSKMAKAESLGIKMISEDDFLDLLRTRPASKLVTNSETNKRKRESPSPEKIKRNKGESPKDKEKSPEKSNKHHDSPKKVEQKKIENSSKNSEQKKGEHSPKKVEKINSEELESSSADKEDTKTSSMKKEHTDLSTLKTDSQKPLVSNAYNAMNDGLDHMTALVEKYRPKEMKQIIGQGTEKSNAKKLLLWLTNWNKNHGKNSKATKPKFSYKDDTGAIYKAALLSGPPGIGKTTTAYVVCSQLGYEVIEFNASDTRSKKLLQEEIAGILKNKTLKDAFAKGTSSEKNTSKHILLMDEVDGMAGNEDRGGMQELISFIKCTEIPIICICNDRQSQKIKTLANYTFDLRFQKPKLEQIRAAMMSLCFKEGIKVKPDEMTQIIQSTNQDIRQVVNHVAMLAAKGNIEKIQGKERTEQFKNVRLGPWDVVRKVFSAEEHKHMSFHDKSSLFFHDYNISPLFVEENYLNVTPAGSRKDFLEKIAKAAESLAYGDIIENNIRSNQAWSLLPVQACFSSVIPGTIMSGFINSQINFPSWLGKNSKRNKCDRQLQDITIHARIATGASKNTINLDYIRYLVDSIIRPLTHEGTGGVEKAIDIMNKYHFTREDLDSLVELTKWSFTSDPMQSIDTKTKTAFTKAYNKTALFSGTTTMKKKSSKDSQVDDFLDEEENDDAEDDEKEDQIENDKMIKAKTTSKSKSAPSESRGKEKKSAKPKASHTKK